MNNNNFVDNKKNNELNEIVDKIIVEKKRCLKLISISANDNLGHKTLRDNGFKDIFENKTI